MSTLEHTFYAIRRGWHFSSAFLFSGAFAAIFVEGSFRDFWKDSASRFAIIVLFGAWALVFGFKAHRRFSNGQTTRQKNKERDDLELGLLLVVLTYGVVQLAGGMSTLLYPMVLLSLALLVIYTPRWVGFTLMGSAVAIEVAMLLFRPGEIEMYEVVVHAVFIVVFALFNLVFTRTEIVRARIRTQKQVEEAKNALQSDARDFRLTSSTSRHGWSMSREEETERRTQSSMSQVRVAMYHHVDLLKRTLRLNTCAVLWVDASEEKLRVRECISDTENIVTKPFYKGEGVVGATLKSGKPLRMNNIRPGYTGLTYYARPCAVTDFVGLPIIESGGLRGVLCADRINDKQFEKEDIEALSAAVESLLNIIANERVFNQLQKAKSEQSKLLLASDTLSKNLAEKDVVKAALEAASEIVEFDMGIVALADESGRQVICHATGKRSEDLEGESVTQNKSLAASALKALHYLPYRGEFEPRQQTLFSKRTQKIFMRMRSTMVLPLSIGNTALGTLTLTSTKPAQFDEEVRTTLQVMTNQLSTVLQNARMYQKIEAMATTDGLTGLPNHRVFKEELEKKMASASRFKTNLSVIFCDVDKFKGVNDTYGHPVGDVVLKGLGEILKNTVVRDTDLPARYGGEEFGIICEGTDTKGAVKLAERIRKDLEMQVFRTDQGELRVTISMGVATYRHNKDNKELLLERADTALYAAKEGGRNQVRVWEPNL